MIQLDNATVYWGSNLDILPTLPDNSVDSIVTDPPYELGFMGKSWDSSGIAYSVELWTECMRVLKPGGHLLAFGGSRTWHRLAVAIEDAGFEMRDSIAWLYGSGFPKSMDVSKAIDKTAPRAGMFEAFANHFSECWDISGLKRSNLFIYFPHYKNPESIMAQVSNWKLGKNVPSKQDFEILKPLLGLSDEFSSLIDRVEAEREVVGSKMSGIANKEEKNRHTIGASKSVEVDITAPATPEALKWQGWGTALKPAFEPVVVARKPFKGTVASNVLEWGVGGLNIDGSRISAGGESFEGLQGRPIQKLATRKTDETDEEYRLRVLESPGQQAALEKLKTLGRWPANIILDPYTAELLDEQSGILKSGALKPGRIFTHSNVDFRKGLEACFYESEANTGGASRFFKVAEAQKHDRMSVCENTPAKIVANYFRTIRAIIENTAQMSVDTMPSEQLGQAVKAAEILCDLCAMSIARDLAALKTLASKEATSPHFQHYISDCANSTLTQNLASLVGEWVNTDTIPTTTSFGRLFGCVLLATDENTRLANLGKGKDQTPFLYQAKASKRDRNEGLADLQAKQVFGDEGGTYQGLSNSKEPSQNFHPTVKPTSLMEYLIKLVTPEGGTVLDPFTGSGSTGKAALLNGFQFIGIELTEEYLPIIEGRLKWANEQRTQQNSQSEQEEKETLF